MGFSTDREDHLMFDSISEKLDSIFKKLKARVLLKKKTLILPSRK
jgi:hypothetical protein